MKLNPDVKICAFTQLDLTLHQLKQEHFDMVVILSRVFNKYILILLLYTLIGICGYTKFWYNVCTY